MQNNYYLSEIVAQLGGTIFGVDKIITDIAALKNATATQISFLADMRLKEDLAKSQAGAVIVKQGLEIDLAPQQSGIYCADPYLYFARVANLFHPPLKSSQTIADSAVIDASACIAASAEIGAQVTIGKQVKIGANTRILAGCVLEDGVEIGSDCLIHPNVTILHHVLISNQVEIHANSVIGSDGFGLAWNGENWEKIPQVGTVEIFDGVEIGSNVSIDRGTIENTIIRKGVKIDNLVQIAHNCEIGDYTALAAMVGMAGSTKIGKYCKIAGAVKFTGHLEVADYSFIAGATIVSHSIKKAGNYAGSYPFQTYQEWKYNAVLLRQLKQLNQRIKQLEKQAIDIADRLNKD